MKQYDVIVIGGGQSALALAYFLKKTGLDYVLLDKEKSPGGSWQHTWDSLTLFSTSDTSSLPGWLMPHTNEAYPTKDEVISYLTQYENRYGFNIVRPAAVTAVFKTPDGFLVQTEDEFYISKAVVSATGIWSAPFIPQIKGRDSFTGIQLHVSCYKNPNAFKDVKVLVVGGGNSGAQILAELSMATEAVWSTLTPPKFLPDDVDGRVLFNIATQKYLAQKEGRPFDPSRYNLGNIVMVPSVAAARNRGILHSKGSFSEMYADGVIWHDGTREQFDVIIWCTGFQPATGFLHPLGILDTEGKVKTTGTKALDVEGLWLVGYGNWTGFASAALIGVGRSARETVQQVDEYVKSQDRQS